MNIMQVTRQIPFMTNMAAINRCAPNEQRTVEKNDRDKTKGLKQQMVGHADEHDLATKTQ